MPSFRLPELPADEKYSAPPAVTSLTAWVTTPPLVGRDDARRLAVLERRLHEIDDVVDDDVAAGGAQRRGCCCAKLRDRRERGREVQLRAGREVVDDLEHRRAFVAGRAGLCRGSTVTGPRSPDAWLPRGCATPSDSTPILTPVPSEP